MEAYYVGRAFGSIFVWVMIILALLLSINGVSSKKNWIRIISWIELIITVFILFALLIAL